VVAPTADVGAHRDSRVHALRALLLAALCVEFTFALVARGGFFSPDSTIVLIWSLALLSISYFLATDRRSIRAEEVILLLLAAWWLVTARLHGAAGNFQPMGASIVSFVAAAAIVRQTPWLWRRNGALVAIALSAATAVAGLVACDLRWYPLAMRGQDLWRLAGTVTYSNATGLLLGMGLLLAMDRTMQTRWSSFAIAACTAGLIATQSRSAVLAALVAFAWLARREFRAALVPLSAGSFAGIVTVANSNGHAGRPLALCVSMPALALVPTVSEWMQRSSGRWRSRTLRAPTAALGAIGAAILFGALLGARSEALKRIDLGSDFGRLHEWRSALQQFHTSIWTGVGPDQLLVISKPKGTSTYFAHNEYLQLLAGGGLIALGLLATAVVLIVRRQHSSPVYVRTACGALVVFALAGLFDYSWHVPAITLLAGMMLGLAQPDAEIPARA
jgi:hypothetical protein